MRDKVNTFKAVLITLLLFGGSLLAMAQKATEISLDYKNTKMETVLLSIKQQSGLEMVFSDQVMDIDGKVTIQVKKASLDSALQQLFRNTSVSYEVKNGKIYLKKKTTEQVAKIHLKGVVKDATDEGVIGANIRLVGSDAVGTITNLDGEFELDVPDNGTIEVSYIGYVTQQVPIKKRTSLSVLLKEDSKMLDEVVVVGYGSMKKKDLTGALSVVKGDDLAGRKTTNLSIALQGATPGVTVTRSSGDPESTGSIRIRGITTISNADPLVIVDGIPSKIDLVNPDDVESMTVLKDAASASIYGARAAAGVIVITTKRAKESALDMTYSYEHTWEIPTEQPDYVDAQQYMLMCNEILYNDNPSGGWWQTYTEDQITNWKRLNASNPDKYPMANWQKAVIKSSSSRQIHSVTLSGGNKTVRTKASFRYDLSDALYVNKEYNRYMIRVNNDIDVNKYISAHIDVNFKRSESVSPVDSPWGSRRTPPIYAIQWSDGRWGDVKDGGNVLPCLYDGGSKTQWYNQLGGKAGLDISPLPGLKLSGVVAVNYYFNKFKTFTKALYYTNYDYPNDPKPMAGHQKTNLTENRNDGRDITYQLFANYDKSWDKHHLSAMVGYETFYNTYENLSASRDRFAMTSFPYLDRGNSSYQSTSGNADHNAYRSFFGRVAYNFADRYLLQVNVRRDGSSRFAKKNSWGNFPSASFGYVISEEPFMKNLGWEWLSNLKLKASYGTLGNEQIGTNFPYQALLTVSEVLLYGPNGNSETYATAAQYDYAVEDITWETTKTWNIGFEANFLNNRLWANADFYRKKTEDMLMNLTIPRYIGFSDPKVNAGTMQTNGFEIELGWRDHIGKLNYSISANLSDFISKITYLKGQNIGSSVQKVNIEGGQFQEWYGYLSDRLFLTEEDLQNSPKTSNNVKVGDIKYKDISGPDGVPDGKISPEYDRVLLGGSLPRFSFGLRLAMDYKGVDFSATFQGVGKQNARISQQMVEPKADNWLNHPAILVGNYWSALNTDEENARMKYPRLTAKGSSNNYAMSDYWMFNGRYLRLKNLTLGYTFSQDWLKKMFVKKLRVYVAANDLFCLNKYPKGWDPEVGGIGYPITTSLMVGASINF